LVPRREFLDLNKRRSGAGDVFVAEVLADCCGVELFLHPRKLQESGQFASEGKATTLVDVVEGFLSEPISGEKETLALWGVEAKGEHAVEIWGETCAPPFVGVEENLRVTACPEWRVWQVVLADFSVIVNLAVVYDNRPGLGVGHGLLALV
jgi:hypothetical protein